MADYPDSSSNYEYNYNNNCNNCYEYEVTRSERLLKWLRLIFTINYADKHKWAGHTGV